MRTVIPILYNFRSIHNVGSIFRTADGLGITQVITVGTSPHLGQPKDSRLPHVVARAEKQLNKTALGAESLIENIHFANWAETKRYLEVKGIVIVSLETQHNGTDIAAFSADDSPVGLVLGSETDGLPKEIIRDSNHVLEIPMSGVKGSFNVSIAGAIALYQLTR